MSRSRRRGGVWRRRLVQVQVVALVAISLVAAGPAAAGGTHRAPARPGAALWHARSSIPRSPSGARSYIHPTSYRSYTLDRAGMASRLAAAPLEFTAAARRSPLVLSLPTPRGGFARFAVQESPVVAPKLGARFPFIRTYDGRGIDDPAATIRLDLGLSGFHAQVLSPSGDWYIDPYYHLDQSAYVSYFSRNLPNEHGRFVEHGLLTAGGIPAVPTQTSGALDAARTVGTELRTYRLALAADGEYSTFQGGTVASVHNELVVAVNRVTGVYERELAIRLQLVANNDSLIYLNPGSDPYTNTNPSALLTQNQGNIDAVIGNANYDVGHVFSTGGGGLAALAVVGRTGLKAEGETGLSSPIGDAFYIDYVAHEMGHEFGANHTFNGVTGSCAGNGVKRTAMEPGSGATIMAYAGICGTDDLQPHSDAYFHAVSFDEIAAYTTTAGSPGNLGASASGNNAPAVSVNGGAAFTIPVRTPFLLSATGSDVDPDTLTYTWEQYDGGALRTLNNASKPSGALFRSFDPTTDPTRVFPRMSSVLANATDANTGTCPALPGGLNCWVEFLPTVARTMTFRVSVRDNDPAAGGVSSADTVVTAAGTAPFLVTSPNTAVSLPGGSTQLVTWNVAGTDLAPISTANVNILLSTDGGNTFPTTLAANTPNDGLESITLPGVTTTQARVKVEAVGNIYFDVSDANFSITVGGNVSPVANPDGAGTPQNTPVQIDVVANDTDSDGTVDPTTVVVASPPAHGGTSVNPTTGVITYTPALNFSGPDSFTYTVQDDGAATSNAATVSITVGGGGGGTDVFPSTFRVQVGSTSGGTAASLAADDNNYLLVNSTRSGAASWFGTFKGIDNGLTSLTAAFTGKSSITCTQVISIFRWTDSTWVQLDSRPVGTSEVQASGLTPSGTPADFVSATSGPGKAKVRISCSAGGRYTLSGDLLKLTV